jgi:hypothetical protein
MCFSFSYTNRKSVWENIWAAIAILDPFSTSTKFTKEVVWNYLFRRWIGFTAARHILPCSSSSASYLPSCLQEPTGQQVYAPDYWEQTKNRTRNHPASIEDPNKPISKTHTQKKIEKDENLVKICMSGVVEAEPCALSDRRGGDGRQHKEKRGGRAQRWTGIYGERAREKREPVPARPNLEHCSRWSNGCPSEEDATAVAVGLIVGVRQRARGASLSISPRRRRTNLATVGA